MLDAAADLVASRRQGAGSSFRQFAKARRLVYASLGCGRLYFDFFLVRGLRRRGASIGLVVLVDLEFGFPESGVHGGAARAAAPALALSSSGRLFRITAAMDERSPPTRRCPRTAATNKALCWGVGAVADESAHAIPSAALRG